MNFKEKSNEIATERLQLISPLLAEGLDPAKAKQLRVQICTQAGISERTLRRYMAMFHSEGFNGLIPKSRGRREEEGAIPEEILEQAIILRREVPQRSVAQIIQILEWEELIEPGQIKRSTLQEKLTKRGYSSRHMQLYASGGIAARRYQKKYRNKIWHSDIKYGIYLPIGYNGSPKRVYLVVFLDDCTRFILHGEFYATLDKVIVEDCYRKSIQKYGKPEGVYFDNGGQYRNKWMARTCSKMGVRLLYARPYSPESTGKPEKYNQLVDNFLAEVALKKPDTLDEMNRLFQVWLEECYQYKPHGALDGKSPHEAYYSDKKALNFLTPEMIADAFLHSEQRKVDKSGCISFQGVKYEVGVSFVGCKVDVVYDPADTTRLTIEYEGHKPWTAEKLVIGERTGPRPPMPSQMKPLPAKTSRLLDAAEKKNEDRKEKQNVAVSYREIEKDGEKNV